MAKPVRIPFDSLTLKAVVSELRPFLGAKVQRVTQPDETTLVLGLYAGKAEAYLLLSCHPEFSRAHLISRRPGNPQEPPTFCATLRARLGEARLAKIEQIRFDRVLHLDFESPSGNHRLIAELMGKHSNLILVNESGYIVTAAKFVGPSKSVRPILNGREYLPPPLPIRDSLLESEEGEDLRTKEGASPFLIKLLEAEGAGALSRLQAAARTETWEPVYSPGNGAYPISVGALELEEVRRQSLSMALEQHFAEAIKATELRELKASLLAQLKRVLLAREVALAELRQAKDAAARAREVQLKGELILAYGHTLEPGHKELRAEDYEGRPVEIRLDPDLSFLENANRYFEKAKRAKAGAAQVADQIKRIDHDREHVAALLKRVESEDSLGTLLDLKQEAERRRWLHHAPTPGARKEERPYEGHRIKELLGPGGVAILYGENATSNDYLTLRVAKPDDWWLHVRGSASAHVVIPTRKHPEKVSREALLFAAQVAVRNSPSKHSGYVPVDYTLKKYVRKPRGAPPGTALYTQEKTLHVEGD